MTNHTEEAPMLPPASVDFNKLHDAMVAGQSHEQAIETAVYAETLGRPVEEREVPAADQGGADDGLDSWTKPQLRERLDKLEVSYESDANKPRLLELARATPNFVPAEANPDIIATEPGTDAPSGTTATEADAG